MAYDLLIKNGLIVDGSGMPAFRGDVGVKDGKIVEIGKLTGAADRTVDADGLAVAPGFIDNHCHYDAQVTWDPLCTFSPRARRHHRHLRQLLAVAGAGAQRQRGAAWPSSCPMSKRSRWRCCAPSMSTGRRSRNTWTSSTSSLGVNVGKLIGHTAVRHYVMGDDCQKRGRHRRRRSRRCRTSCATACRPARSASRCRAQKGHFDPQGVPIPALWADEKEIFALADVLRELGTGTIQVGGGVDVGAEGRHDARGSPKRPAGPVVYNSLAQTVRNPDEWKIHMARVEETAAVGIRAYPMCSPNRVTQDFTMKNCQVFRGLPTWHPILLCLGRGEAARLRRSGDPRQAARGSGRHRPDPARSGSRRPGGTTCGSTSRCWRRTSGCSSRSIGADRRDAGQAGDRRLPRPGRRGKARNPFPAGREQHRRRGAAARS